MPDGGGGKKEEGGNLSGRKKGEEGKVRKGKTEKREEEGMDGGWKPSALVHSD